MLPANNVLIHCSTSASSANAIPHQLLIRTILLVRKPGWAQSADSPTRLAESPLPPPSPDSVSSACGSSPYTSQTLRAMANAFSSRSPLFFLEVCADTIEDFSSARTLLLKTVQSRDRIAAAPDVGRRIDSMRDRANRQDRGQRKPSRISLAEWQDIFLCKPP